MNRAASPARTGPGRNQQGFTLIEVMVASTVGLILLLAAFSFFLETARMAEMMGSRMRLSDEARLMQQLIWQGGRAPGGLVEISGLQNSYGLVGGLGLPDNIRIQKQGQRLVLSVGLDQLASTEDAANIECTGAGTPHPDCAVAGPMLIDGYLAEAPDLSSDNRSLLVDRHCDPLGQQRSVIAELDLFLMDGQLLGTRDSYTQDQVQRRFHQAMAMQVDCAP